MDDAASGRRFAGFPAPVTGDSVRFGSGKCRGWMICWAYPPPGCPRIVPALDGWCPALTE